MKDKVVIITGSSRGIGKTTAIELAKKGAKLIINSRDKNQLIEVQKEINLTTKDCYYVCADLSTKEGSKELIDFTMSTYGQIDVLINNIGLSMRGNVSELHPEVIEKTFQSNVYSKIYPSIYALPHLRKSKGSIIFVSSLAAIHGLPGLSAYSASKSALKSFAEAIRIEESDHDLHIGVVYVAQAEIEKNKEVLAADGKMKVLKTRTKKNLSSKKEVADAIIKNIEQRRRKTVLTTLGKLNYFLQSLSPWLVEKIIILNKHKFEKGAE